MTPITQTFVDMLRPFFADFLELVEPGLVELPTVVLTPHLGSAARGTRARIADLVADSVVAAIEGRRPPNVCNPEVYR